MTNGGDGDSRNIDAMAPREITDSGALTPVDPRYRTVLRISIALATVPFLIAAAVLEIVRPFGSEWLAGVMIVPVLILAIALVWRWPNRRYAARGYDLGIDRLRVVRGVMWRSDTVVPFGRIQHIDVTRGPVERLFGLSTLVVHTAGNHNHAVPLPGLREDTAAAMREEIRAHIKRETR